MVASMIFAALLATGGALVARTLRRSRLEAPAPAGPGSRIQAFLDESPGTLELRVLGEKRRVRLENPSVEQVLSLVGAEGGELWRLEGPGPVAFVQVPPPLRPTWRQNSPGRCQGAHFLRPPRS